MLGELVNTTTKDLVKLDGFFAQANAPQRTPYDSAVITHGLGGNFYSSRLLKFVAEQLTNLGISIVLANTRGHDLLATGVRSGRISTLGAGFETVADCQHDLNAWSEFLGRRKLEQQIWLGHSLGAIKSLFAMAHAPNEKVKCLVALSATRLNHERLISSPAGDEFRNMLRNAEGLIEADRGDELMRVSFPFATWMAANPYREKYGPENRYDWFQFADRINVPTLLLLGGLELKDHPAFSGMEQDLQPILDSNQLLELSIIDNADHFYSGTYRTVGDVLTKWLLQQE